MSHASPHFNRAGGCVCGCRRCLRVLMTPIGVDKVRIRQTCSCKGCSEDCPGDRNQIVYVPAGSPDNPADPPGRAVVRAQITELNTGAVIFDATYPLGTAMTFRVPATADARISDMTVYRLELS